MGQGNVVTGWGGVMADAAGRGDLYRTGYAGGPGTGGPGGRLYDGMTHGVMADGDAATWHASLNMLYGGYDLDCPEQAARWELELNGRLACYRAGGINEGV